MQGQLFETGVTWLLPLCGLSHSVFLADYIHSGLFRPVEQYLYVERTSIALAGAQIGSTKALIQRADQSVSLVCFIASFNLQSIDAAEYGPWMAEAFISLPAGFNVGSGWTGKLHECQHSSTWAVVSLTTGLNRKINNIRKKLHQPVICRHPTVNSHY